ncbi:MULTISPECIES: hypothetical protein [Vibrio]|nr:MULTISPECIES: hypothetical protein [Vibrio]MBO0146440.1 hypothetical protein [Vibrio sp. Vb2424]MCR9439867.1 hypothetical protein [Vibrio alginolyticus]TOA64646.1 hypothetical protein CGK24_05920 [Vibrio parahaemolyticus]
MFVILKNCKPHDYRGDFERQECLQRILECHGHRTHIIKSNKSLCDDIINAGFYGERYEKYAEDLRQHKSELNQFKNSFNYTFTLDFDIEDENVFSKNKDNDHINITISYKLAKLESFYRGATLLAEDETDCEFFDLIASAYAKFNYGKSIISRINYLEGGGSKTHPKYLRMMKDNTFGLCIVDNDKKHPESKEGSTSSKFKNNGKERGLNNNQEAIVLDFHEAESIIPDSILETIIDKTKIDDFDNVINLDKKINYRFRKYFDHKNGISLKDAWILDKNRNEKFWENALKNLNAFNHKPCRETKTCANSKNEQVCHSCIEINGFGQNILEHSINQLNRVHLRTVTRDLSPYIAKQWDAIGCSVLNWSCSPDLPKLRSS